MGKVKKIISEIEKSSLLELSAFLVFKVAVILFAFWLGKSFPRAVVAGVTVILVIAVTSVFIFISIQEKKRVSRRAMRAIAANQANEKVQEAGKVEVAPEVKPKAKPKVKAKPKRKASKRKAKAKRK